MLHLPLFSLHPQSKVRDIWLKCHQNSGISCKMSTHGKGVRLPDCFQVSVLFSKLSFDTFYRILSDNSFDGSPCQYLFLRITFAQKFCLNWDNWSTKAQLQLTSGSSWGVRKSLKCINFSIDEMCAPVYTSCMRIFARIFMKIWLVVEYYLMNISFNFHKDLSFRWEDMPPPQSSAQDPPSLDRVKIWSFESPHTYYHTNNLTCGAILYPHNKWTFLQT